MKFSLTALATGLALFGSASAFAASTVDLTVTGLIVPSACTPSLSNGGVVDHGKISAQDLNQDNDTLLPDHKMTLTVVCDGTILVALNAIDNRAGSSNNHVDAGFGLGLINGTQKLGHFYLVARRTIADGVEARPIISMDGGNSWIKYGDWNPTHYLSVAAMDDPSQPLPVKEFTSELDVWTYIAPANGLDLSDEVSIDGSATLEVKYL
ncbi:DUF1120 domain-containing protein [Pseudomonas sp. T1.Ur]|uniref:DUF1120 domain-containing protein n=1 Tax=Pseudomonas sp. T1.Ur TaxID=2928704 RepID=UPI00201D3F33|nr:DUF1120 domain-containing protein [Pseudomonas sp. T1.Ur]MCL6703638.1 DUF1120 domain-containing protein [Pseudomonas sp. T1.Ur]